MARRVGVCCERLLIGVFSVGRGVSDDLWLVAVGAHVIEVSGELHLLGLLAERLPDGRRLHGASCHRQVGTVVELIPRPAGGSKGQEGVGRTQHREKKGNREGEC